jgi:hypothetical protein
MCGVVVLYRKRDCATEELVGSRGKFVPDMTIGHDLTVSWCLSRWIKRLKSAFCRSTLQNSRNLYSCSQLCLVIVILGVGASGFIFHPFLSLRIYCRYGLGHIKIDVYMEIHDDDILYTNISSLICKYGELVR